MSPRYHGDFWGSFPPRPPKLPPPARGIKVKKIGATWWGQRWIEALLQISAGYGSRLARGRTYARAGRVHDLEVEPGVVRAKVTGSSRRPYDVTLAIPVLPAAAWQKAIAAMAQQAVFAAELLSGRLPQEIDRAFAAARRSLFPADAKDLRTDCSCPDWANPCKHVAAAHYVLGEAFDRDPFLLFELRGRKKEQVLRELRALRAGGQRPAAKEQRAPRMEVVGLAGRKASDYDRLQAPLAAMSFRLEPPASPATLLVQLGKPVSWSLQQSPAELLGEAYAAASALALEMSGTTAAMAEQGGSGRLAGGRRSSTASASQRSRGSRVAPRASSST